MSFLFLWCDFTIKFKRQCKFEIFELNKKKLILKYKSGITMKKQNLGGQQAVHHLRTLNLIIGVCEGVQEKTAVFALKLWKK